jgi:hypothetical protein
VFLAIPMGEKFTYNPVAERQSWVHPFVSTQTYL